MACSTCDHTKFIEHEKIIKKGKEEIPIKYLKADINHLALDISCDTEGKNFKIGDFTIYRCPTCGRKLY